MKLIDLLSSRFPGAITGGHEDYGDETVFIDKKSILPVMEFLKNSPETHFDLLLDICGVDYLGQDPRFEVVYHLYSFPCKARARIRVKVSEKDLSVPSVISVWEAADWFEREAYDLFGIRFEGHPKMKRLLMWEEFQGHPLRKDYPMNKRQPIPVPAKLI